MVFLLMGVRGSDHYRWDDFAANPQAGAATQRRWGRHGDFCAAGSGGGSGGFLRGEHVGTHGGNIRRLDILKKVNWLCESRTLD